MISQALVKIVGDESNATAALKRFNAAAVASERQFDKDFGKVAQIAGRTSLALAGIGAAVAIGMHKANAAYDDLVASNRRLDSASKLTGVSLSTLAENAAAVQKKFKLAVPEANELTTTIAKLTSKSGDIAKSSQAMEAFLNLGAAQGLNVTETLTAVQQAVLGIDEGTDKLFQKNPSVLYAEYAAKIGTTAGKLDDQQKAQALVNAALEAGSRVGGAYQGFLETAAGKQQVLNSQIQQTSAKLAEAWQPARLTVLEAMSDAVERLATVIENNKDGIEAFFNMLAKTATEGPPGFAAANRIGAGQREFFHGPADRAISALFGPERERLFMQAHGHAASGTDLGALRGLVTVGGGIGLTGSRTSMLSSTFGARAAPPTFQNPLGNAPRKAPPTGKPLTAAEKEARLYDEYIQSHIFPTKLSAYTTDKSSAYLSGASTQASRLLYNADTPSAASQTMTSLEAATQRVQMFGDAVFDSMMHATDGVTTLSGALGRMTASLAAAGGRQLLSTGLSRISDWRNSDKLGAHAAALIKDRGGAMDEQIKAATAASSAAAAGGPAGIGFAAAGLALQIIPKLFNGRESEESNYRAHLRALRDARRDTINVTLVMPNSTLNPARDPAFREAVANTLLEVGDGRIGRLKVETR